MANPCPVNDRSLRLNIVLACLLALVTAIAFQPAIHCQFNLIDDLVISQQPHVNTGLTAANVRWAFSTFELGYPIPVTLLSFMADIEVFGPNATAFHAENVAWHVVNVLLLYVLLWRMTGSALRSAAVSVLFAVHPLRAESVAWVTERKDVLAAFFGLLAMHAFVTYARRPRLIPYLLIALLLALSLFAKPMLVMLPLLLLGLDYWPLRRTGASGSLRRLLLEKAPLAIVAMFSIWVGMLGQGTTQPARHLRSTQFHLGQLAANALVSHVRYIFKVFWFRRLGVGYPLVPHWPGWLVADAIVWLLAVTVFALWQARSRPWLAAGWFWYAILLLPASGLYVLGDFSIADRYTYFPMIGLLIMLIWSVPSRLALPAAIVIPAVVIGLVVATRKQVWTWQDNISLFTHAIETVGPNDSTCDSLAISLTRAGRRSEAIPYYDQAIRINPNNMDAHINLAIALDQLGDYAAAVPHYQIAVDATPNDPQCYYNLGTDLIALARPREAIPYLLHATELNPQSLEFRANLATALLRSGDFNNAIEQSRMALANAPKATGVRGTLASALAASGRVAEAKVQYEVAILNDKKSSNSYNELGALCLANHGDLALAMSCFKEALRLDPLLASAHNNLGVALAQSDKLEEAAAEFKRALEIDPKFEDARRNLRMAVPPDTLH